MFANYLQWFHGLPIWGQVFISYLGWSFPPWLALGIWEQRSEQCGSHRLKWWVALPLGGAMLYFANETGWGREVASWPDRFIPNWHGYWFCIIPAVLLSGMIAKQVAIAYVRMTSGAPAQSSSALLPGGFDPGFVHIIRRRTFTSWEDE